MLFEQQHKGLWLKVLSWNPNPGVEDVRVSRKSRFGGIQGSMVVWQWEFRVVGLGFSHRRIQARPDGWQNSLKVGSVGEKKAKKSTYDQCNPSP